jgi:iron complex transport system substrate-binding protein
MKNRLPILIFILTLVITLSSLAGCASPAAAPAPSPATLTDQLGRAVTITKAPQRIISLAPSNTEILYALGLADRIIAVTDYCDYPPEAKQKPKIGGFSNPNIESIIALSPDLGVAASIHEKQIIPQLAEKGLTVVALAPKAINEIQQALTLVGKITGKDKEAATLVADMDKRIKAVTDKTSGLEASKRLRTMYLVWHDPLMAAGAKTIQDELITKAGGTNIAAGLADYAKISLEAVIQSNPEVAFAGVGHGTGQEAPLQFLKMEARLKDTAARVNNRIYGVDANMVSRPGPRVVNALEEMAKFIHPELFK